MVLKYVKIVDETTGKCIASNLPHAGFVQEDVTKNIFDDYWYLTYYLESNEEYQKKFLELTKKEKYQEITDGYDRACNYGLAPVKIPGDSENYLANRAWLATWDEAIAGLAYQSTLSTEPPTTFVRLYKKYGDFMYQNVNLKGITAEIYQGLKLQLIDYRFNTLQVARNKMYLELEQAKSIEDILAIKVDFGETLDEQKETNKIVLV